MTPILELDGVSVHFGGVRAVDGVSLKLEAGALYGMVGPNGSGKTTLINAITRVGPLSSGAISFEGADISKMRAYALNRAGLARTFQGIRLLSELSVRDNVMLGADQRRYRSRRRGVVSWRTHARTVAEATDEAIERLDLSAVADRSPDTLSYGAQRRVEIARALAGGPRLLLLDEPVAGMSREERVEIAAVLRSLRSQGLTQLLVEHDLRLILELCDHLFVMNFGQCVADGEPRATASLSVVQEAYLGKRHAVA